MIRQVPGTDCFEFEPAPSALKAGQVWARSHFKSMRSKVVNGKITLTQAELAFNYAIVAQSVASILSGVVEKAIKNSTP